VRMLLSSGTLQTGQLFNHLFLEMFLSCVRLVSRVTVRFHFTMRERTGFLNSVITRYKQTKTETVFLHRLLQFTWRLHSFVVILVRLVAAWFMQRDGKAGCHPSSNILGGGFHSVVTSAVSVQRRNVILDRSTVQSKFRACYADLPPTSGCDHIGCAFMRLLVARIRTVFARKHSYDQGVHTKYDSHR
jgi:hypothetical protein